MPKNVSRTREIVKNLSQMAKCISQTRHDPKCSFYNLIFLLQPLWNQFS